MGKAHSIRTLVVEDDFGSRRLLQMIMNDVARCDVVVDGQEAIEAVQLAWEDNDPYRLILLDIMMPNVDGHTALREIRALERGMNVQPADAVRVIMTTALEDPRNVVQAYQDGEADGYLVKPIDRDKLMEKIREVGLRL